MNHWLALAPLLLAHAAATQGQVHVVDDGGGPGIDFTDVQPAIDAAAEGDVILVKEGVYGACLIDDRALTVCAEAGAVVSVSSLAVRDLAAGKVVRVQGLRSELRTPHAPCYLYGDAGHVWLEDCVFEPSHELAYPTAINGSPGIDASACASVLLVDVSAKGQSLPGGFVGFGGYPAPGAGLLLADSVVSAFGGVFKGGKGAIYTTLSFHSYAQTGGAGIHAPGPGALRASGSTVIGGDGAPSIDGFLGYCVLTPGGVGIATGCYPGCPEVVLHDCSVLGGPGGPPQLFSTCQETGPTGKPLSLAEGTILVTLPSPALELQAPSPVRESTELSVVLHGPPQALAFLGISASPDAFFLPSLSAPLALASPIAALSLGVIPGSGELSLTLPLLELPAGLESMVFHGQAAYLDPQSSVVLGQAGVLVLLDGAF